MVASHSTDIATDASALRSPMASIANIPTPPEWMLDALCSQVDPDIFFPDKGGSTRDAKAICHRCIVREDCLDYALSIEERGDNGFYRFGIWGGLSERERRKLRKRAAPTDHHPTHHDTRDAS